MTSSLRSLAVYGILAGLLLNITLLSITLVVFVMREDGVDRGTVERITDAHLKAHPEIVREVFLDMIKHPPGAPKAAARTEQTSEQRAKLVAANSATIFHSAHQTVIGNPGGKVTVVQFFDYNCGYCRRALGDTTALLKSNPDLRFVLKEYPILGPNSVQAAQVAIALRMQDRSGRMYLPFHERLLSGGVADKQAALDAARAAGANMKALQRDLASAEIQVTLSEDFNLGSKLGVNGTPSYVVGDQIIIGAIGSNALQSAIAEQRSHKS